MKKLNAIALALFVSVGMMSCGSGSTTSEDTEKLNRDSTALVTHLSESVNLQDGMRIDILEFNEGMCRMRVMTPQDGARDVADVLGVGVCTLTAKWLSEKGYTVGHEGIYTTCYVYSPYVGVTAKPDMVIKWGDASYNAFTDSVDWEWEKAQ